MYVRVEYDADVTLTTRTVRKTPYTSTDADNDRTKNIHIDFRLLSSTIDDGKWKQRTKIQHFI
jgi:hypothetical protein